MRMFHWEGKANKRALVEAQIASWETPRMLVDSKNDAWGRHDVPIENYVRERSGCGQLVQHPDIFD